MSLLLSRVPRPSTVIGRTILYVLLIGTILIFLGPLFWLVTSAIKPENEIYRYPIQWLPSRPRLENLVDAWKAVPFARFILNSVIVTVAGTVLTVINATLSSYALTFVKFPFRDVVFFIILGALMLPGDTILVPNYITVSSFGWTNTYQGLVIPTSSAVFGTFLMRQHMRTIPMEIIEAARCDRAGNLRIMAQIVVPMSKPILITTIIVSMVNEWNSFIWPFIVTSTDSMRTLPIGLLFLKSEEGTQSWGTIMAGTLMTALPMIIAFIIAQRQIVAGLTSSARAR